MSESIFAFQVRAENSFRQQLEAKDRELDKAKLALRLEAAKLKVERERARNAVAELRRFRDEFRGKGADRAAYAVIVALLRVQRALGFNEEK